MLLNKLSNIYICCTKKSTAHGHGQDICSQFIVQEVLRKIHNKSERVEFGY